MSRREQTNDKVGNAGVAQTLAALIEKNHVLAGELEALARLVEAETAAAQEREAVQTARLGEALGELAEAKARCRDREAAADRGRGDRAGLATAVDDIKAVVVRFPSATLGTMRDAANDDHAVPEVQGKATPAAVPPTEAAEGCETPDRAVAEDDEDRFALADGGQRTVSIVVKLSPTPVTSATMLSDGNGVRWALGWSAESSIASVKRFSVAVSRSRSWSCWSMS